MNRKSFIASVGAILAAWWSGIKAKATVPSPKGVCLRHLAINTQGYCMFDINRKNAADVFNKALKDISEIISAVHAKDPDMKLLDISCRNILHETCNPEGHVVFFRLLFVQREWTMGRNSTLIGVTTLKGFLEMSA